MRIARLLFFACMCPSIAQRAWARNRSTRRSRPGSDPSLSPSANGLSTSSNGILPGTCFSFPQWKPAKLDLQLLGETEYKD